MNQKFSKCILAIIVIVLFGVGMSQFIISSHISARAYSPQPLNSQDSRDIALLRQSGLHNDLFKVPALIAFLHTSSQPDYIYSSMLALSRMGAEESLPDFDPYIRKTIMQTNLDLDLSNFAQVAKARLLAESETINMPAGYNRAQNKMDKFLDELHLSAEELNLAPQQIKNLRHGDAIPLSLYALRELADMIYQKHDIALAQYAEAKGIHFGTHREMLLVDPNAQWQAQQDGTLNTIDTLSAIKVELAPLPDKQRISWLIDILSKTYTIDVNAHSVIQLAIDEGFPASQAAAAKLKEMQANSDEYNQHSGYAALFDVIAGVGDKRQLSLLEKITSTSPSNELNRYNSHYAAIACRDLHNGITKTYARTY